MACSLRPSTLRSRVFPTGPIYSRRNGVPRDTEPDAGCPGCSLMLLEGGRAPALAPRTGVVLFVDPTAPSACGTDRFPGYLTPAGAATAGLGTASTTGCPRLFSTSRTICARSLASGSSRSMRSFSLPASLMFLCFWISAMIFIGSIGGFFLKVMVITPGAASTFTTP